MGEDTMHFSNYRDFYQKGIIPMNPKTRAQLDKQLNPEESFLLVALDGYNQSVESEFYCWNVVIYQSNRDGYFQEKKPLFISSSYNNFLQAYKSAIEYESILRNDGLQSLVNIDQIS
jgi:hypothetical protein